MNKQRELFEYLFDFNKKFCVLNIDEKWFNLLFELSSNYSFTITIKDKSLKETKGTCLLHFPYNNDYKKVPAFDALHFKEIGEYGRTICDSKLMVFYNIPYMCTSESATVNSSSYEKSYIYAEKSCVDFNYSMDDSLLEINTNGKVCGISRIMIIPTENEDEYKIRLYKTKFFRKPKSLKQIRTELRKTLKPFDLKEGAIYEKFYHSKETL